MPSLWFETFALVNHGLVVHSSHPKTDCIFFDYLYVILSEMSGFHGDVCFNWTWVTALLMLVTHLIRTLHLVWPPIACYRANWIQANGLASQSLCCTIFQATICLWISLKPIPTRSFGWLYILRHPKISSIERVIIERVIDC